MLAGVAVSSEARLGKDPFPGSQNCWQNSVHCYCQTEGLGFLLVVSRGGSVPCHMGSPTWLPASSTPAGKIEPPHGKNVTSSVMESYARLHVHPYHLCHVWLVRSKSWPSPYSRGGGDYTRVSTPGGGVMGAALEFSHHRQPKQ